MPHARKSDKWLEISLDFGFVIFGILGEYVHYGRVSNPD
jgi:hypothetical protein